MNRGWLSFSYSKSSGKSKGVQGTRQGEKKIRTDERIEGRERGGERPVGISLRARAHRPARGETVREVLVKIDTASAGIEYVTTAP